MTGAETAGKHVTAYRWYLGTQTTCLMELSSDLRRKCCLARTVTQELEVGGPEGGIRFLREGHCQATASTCVMVRCFWKRGKNRGQNQSLLPGAMLTGTAKVQEGASPLTLAGINTLGNMYQGANWQNSGLSVTEQNLKEHV